MRFFPLDFIVFICLDVHIVREEEVVVVVVVSCYLLLLLVA